MTYCEVGLTRSVGLIIGGSPIRVGQKSGKEGRKEKKEGGAFSMAQIANFGRSIDRRRRHAQAGFPSLRLLSPAGSGRGRVGYFTSVRAETTERASTLSDPDEVTRSISPRVWKSRANWRATFCGCQINCVSHKTFVPPIASSQTFRIDGAASRHRHQWHRRPRPGRERGQRDWKQSSG